MDSLTEDMDQSGVKTEPNISAENFGIGDGSNSDDEEGDKNDNDDTSVEQSMEHGTSLKNDVSENDDSMSYSSSELTVNEKIEIANFCTDSPATHLTLVRQNFSTKFKKDITLATLQQIVSTGMFTE